MLEISTGFLHSNRRGGQPHGGGALPRTLVPAEAEFYWSDLLAASWLLEVNDISQSVAIKRSLTKASGNCQARDRTSGLKVRIENDLNDR
ncbi:hypothetical protein Thiosp_03333 [Thiorhodovibrio litoralis]|nr:hypothetical protein Thiosp_03333 [Thiorhodovibrio litoralis]